MFSQPVALLLAAFHLSGGAAADAFLAAGPEPAQPHDRAQAFLNDLEQVHDSQLRVSITSLLPILASEMEPTLASMPRNPRGALSSASTRYALHRLFTQRYGWSLKGIAPDGASRTASVLGLGPFLPPHVRELLEAHLGEGGEYAPSDVVLLAATIESLERAEMRDKLRHLYRALGMEVQDELNRTEAFGLIEMYMQCSLLELNISALPLPSRRPPAKRFIREFPYWPRMQELVPWAQQRKDPGLTSFAFSDVAETLELVMGEMPRRLDESSCLTMRQGLLRQEDAAGSGRVALRDFYHSAVYEGMWQFSEGVDYLRSMGMVDESDASRPRLLVANYLYVHPSCQDSSRLTELCCINPCESLMGGLERRLRAPHAAPEEIVSAVLGLQPPPPAASNGTLSPALVRRLADIADHHGGVVALHGRLFAQWMHFAYPRDCPYPHLADTAKLRRSKDWFRETGSRAFWNASQMKSYLEASQEAAAAAAQGEEQDLEQVSWALWTHEEEHPDREAWDAALAGHKLRRSAFSALRGLVLVALVASSAVVMRRDVLRALAASGTAAGGSKAGDAESEGQILAF